MKADARLPQRGGIEGLVEATDHSDGVAYRLASVHAAGLVRVAAAVANASFKREKHNEGGTEVVEFEGRGHSL